MRRALFLDRDGVINVNREGRYCNSVDDFELVDGIGGIGRAFYGWKIIVVTNQAGVAHGYLTMDGLNAIHRRMVELLEPLGVFIDAIYSCTDKDGPFRKPAPGMLLQAQREHGIQMSSSVLIGDNITDIQAGQAAGVGCCILIPSNELGAVPLPR